MCGPLVQALCLSVYMTIEIVGLGGYKVGFIWYTFISLPPHPRFVLLFQDRNRYSP